MNPITVGAVENITLVSPAIRDCIAGPPPLYCTAVNFTPATDSKNRIGEMRRRAVTGRGDEQLAGIRLRVVDQLLQVVRRQLLLTQITVGPVAILVTGMKSLWS